MLPPNVKFGKVNFTGTWKYADAPPAPVTGRLAFDREFGQATRLIVSAPATAPGLPFPVIGTWLRFVSTDPVLVETFVEAGDGEGGNPDTCNQQLLNAENFQCPDWQNLGNGTVDGTPVNNFRRTCNVVEGESTMTFRFDISTDPQNIPVVVVSRIVAADFMSTVTLNRQTSNTQKPAQNTWNPPANCRQ